MSLSTPGDIPTQIIVPSSAPNAAPLVSTERRLTPSWPVSTLKAKLEPITGIPFSSQSLHTQAVDGSWTPMTSDSALLSTFNLRKGGVIEVIDTRPKGAQVNFNDVGSVEKYVMPEDEYEKRDDSVMAWKRRQKLGRFDPKQKNVEEMAAERREKDGREVREKGIKVDMRARVGRDDGKRGMVKWVAEVEGLGGEREKGCVWVGIELDEPVGRNDGSVDVEKEGGGKQKVKLWGGKEKYGVLVRPEKVEVGAQWTVIDDLTNEDMEEI